MRSASVLCRFGTLGLLLGAAGCSTVSGGYDAVRDAVTPSTRASSSTPATGSAPAAPARAAPAVYDTPVNPATQRAFDDAADRRAAGRAEDERQRGEPGPGASGSHRRLLR